MKVLTVFGTRPEAIKMCPVILELKKHPEINSITCLTGQHREMLQQVLDVFAINAEYNLDIMQIDQNLFSITTNVLNGLKQILEKENPDIILVHGDTTTSFAAGLAGYYMQIPVGHIEAGLRTYNKYSPFPEEFNRQAIDIFASFYFAPTEAAKGNLLKEGKQCDSIYVTGNTVIDAMKNTLSTEYVDENLSWSSNGRMILLTMHRRENLGKPMRQVFRACCQIINKYSDVKIIYPIHSNPQIRKIAKEELIGCDRIRLIEPLDVVAFHNYINRCYFVMTDSGGIQEEAPSLGKPVLVLRDTTERPEGIAAGTLKLIGTSEESVFIEAKRLLEDTVEYAHMSTASTPYGDGMASVRIVNILLEYMNRKNRNPNEK